MKQSKVVKNPNDIRSYFKLEKGPLLCVTISGLIYNIGMVSGPYFEGQLVQRLFDIMRGRKTVADMTALVLLYLLVIFVVQGMRCVKRFYVRRFANDTSRNMRHMLYNSLVHQNRKVLEKEGVGNLMTKAVSDVDTCVEGMRKFTTELFDTGIVLIAYLTMLFLSDWRLAAISCLFTLVAYMIAERLKVVVTKYQSNYKKSAAALNTATLDRVENAITYRVYGREQERTSAYTMQLEDYEKKAVAANIWGNAMQPVYHIISMCGVIFVLYFGAKNVTGTGWVSWNIAAFTTFLSCFSKMALKSSKAAKLFQAVQKAQVSWERIKPLMQEYIEETEEKQKTVEDVQIAMENVSAFYEDAKEVIFKNLSLHAKTGEIIGVTGPVASGKSTFGKLWQKEASYQGKILIDQRELATLPEDLIYEYVSFLGHQPELMSDTIAENISLGDKEDITPYLEMVCMEEEVEKMQEKDQTFVGSGGRSLSGGQQDRVALARTLYHGRKILVLDDPFSAVDQKTEEKIMEHLKQFGKGKIIFLISHRLYQFPDMSQIIWLENGRAEVSNHETLMRENSTYAGLYHTQTAGGDLDA